MLLTLLCCKYEFVDRKKIRRHTSNFTLKQKPKTSLSSLRSWWVWLLRTFHRNRGKDSKKIFLYSPQSYIQTAEVRLHSFWNSLLGAGLVVNNKFRFITWERIRTPKLTVKKLWWAPELVSTVFGENALPISEFEPRSIESVASRCTDYSNLTPRI
jgi:hypothetical protein